MKTNIVKTSKVNRRRWISHVHGINEARRTGRLDRVETVEDNACQRPATDSSFIYRMHPNIVTDTYSLSHSSCFTNNMIVYEIIIVTLKLQNNVSVKYIIIKCIKLLHRY